ncbi:MAG: DUF1189 family protein [Mycobacterium leprae]
MAFVSDFKDATIGFKGYARLVRSKGSGFGYLSLLLLIVLVISCVISTVQAKREFDAAAGQLAAAPDFALQNGEVTFNGPMPYTMKGDNNMVVIIDTTGKTTADALKGAAANSVLITKNAFYQVKSPGSIQSTDLSALPLTITKATVLGFMQNLHWFVPVGYLFIYAFQLGFKALDAVILALIAMLFASGWRKRVEFGVGWKIGLYAVTIPTLLQWLWPGYSTMHLATFALWWAIAILYTVMGLRAHFNAEAGI